MKSNELIEHYYRDKKNNIHFETVWQPQRMMLRINKTIIFNDPDASLFPTWENKVEIRKQLKSEQEVRWILAKEYVLRQNICCGSCFKKPNIARLGAWHYNPLLNTWMCPKCSNELIEKSRYITAKEK